VSRFFSPAAYMIFVYEEHDPRPLRTYIFATRDKTVTRRTVLKSLARLSRRQTDRHILLFTSVHIGRATYVRIHRERYTSAFAEASAPRGVTCYFGACRNQTHISCDPLSCHRYKTTGQTTTCKRSSLVCFVYGVARRAANTATTFNGTPARLELSACGGYF